MKVGDLVKDRKTKKVGFIINKKRDTFVYVCWSCSSFIELRKIEALEVINESR